MKNPAPVHAISITNQDLISKASKAKNGATFAALWRGDFTAAGYDSQSEADAALLSALYFWTGGDKSRSLSLFDKSGLNRDKWQREDYRESTWQLIAHGETYAPRPNRANIACEYLGDDDEQPQQSLIERLEARIYSAEVKHDEPTPRYSLNGIPICTPSNLTTFSAHAKGW